MRRHTVGVKLTRHLILLAIALVSQGARAESASGETHLQTSHAMMLCLFFGLLEVSEEEDARSNTTAPESGNAHQMIDFLNTLAFAASTKLDVLIDS
jgi:hypothetical protein